MINDLEVKRDISAKLDWALTQGEWRLLEAHGHLRKYPRDIEISGLASIVQQWRNATQARPAGLPLGGIQAPRSRVGNELVSARARVVSELLAEAASTHPSLEWVHKTVLSGKLLRPDDVGDWIRRQGEIDGAHTWWLRVPVPPGHDLDYEPKGITTNPPLSIDSSNPAQGVHTLALEFDDGRTINTKFGGVLDQIRQIGESLAEEYGWTRSDATVFILSGRMPAVRAMSSTVAIKRIPATTRITLTVDPAVSPRAVAEHYRTLRHRVFGMRHRSMSEKHLKLGLFTRGRPQDEKLKTAMAAWNKVYPKWRYKLASNFGRDCIAARKRVVALIGEPLPIYETVSAPTSQKVRRRKS